VLITSFGFGGLAEVIGLEPFLKAEQPSGPNGLSLFFS
jgi:hypothetical protein